MVTRHQPTLAAQKINAAHQRVRRAVEANDPEAFAAAYEQLKRAVADAKG